MNLSLSPEMQMAWRQSKLDCRCLDCGESSAARSKCWRCRSPNLEYRIHVPGPKPGEPGERVRQWCQVGETDRPDPNDPRTGKPRPPRKGSQGIKGGSEVAPVT